jgi:ZIP family zinc transporter
MLPNAKTSLTKGGFTPKQAAWLLIGLFIAGVVGIQVVSRVLHRFIPSQVVDCDHTHDDESGAPKHDHDEHQHHQLNKPPEVAEREALPRWRSGHSIHTSYGTSSTPQLLQEDGSIDTLIRRPSLASRVSELVGAKKTLCNEDGQCFGLSAPCGQDCFKIVQTRGRSSKTHPPLARSSTSATGGKGSLAERQLLLGAVDEESALPSISSTPELDQGGYFSSSNNHNRTFSNGHSHGHPHSTKSLSRASSHASLQQSTTHGDHPGEHHHHHVPTNAFLSIGLQTCIAIALHKLPEGFITYATNHANPKLGFSVFVALFIHNITEGFAMALPLYLAVKSRPKAMIWAALLGGVSQPLGAGVAALWFHLAGSRAGAEPGEGVYGGMFAVVAGIMTSVALQLFSESLDLTHNRNLCMAFAFVGMAILGMSSALTA